MGLIRRLKQFFYKEEPELEFPLTAEPEHTPVAVRRHLLHIQEAMEKVDRPAVANYQLRLAKAGFDYPKTLTQCKQMLKDIEE